jgi:hypothetical protein
VGPINSRCGRLGRAHLMREGPTTQINLSCNVFSTKGGANPLGGMRV